MHAVVAVVRVRAQCSQSHHARRIGRRQSYTRIHPSRIARMQITVPQ
jgi:hypothetical protein